MGRIDIDSYLGVDAFGGRDSTGGLQQAITDGEREAATDYVIGPGTYLFTPLAVHGSNLSFHARGRTRLIFTAATGHGIQLMGGNPQHDLTFEGLELDGQSGYGINNGVWDIENKAVAQFANATAHFDRITFRGCDFHGWRGEMIYGGGYPVTLGKLTVEDCDLHDGNAEGISHGGVQIIRRNRIRKLAIGIESFYAQAVSSIEDNEIGDCDLDGIAVVTINASEPYGPAYIERNRLTNCKRAGIAGYGTRNAWVRKNTLTDCGWAGVGHGPLYFETSGLWQGSTTRDLHVRDNDVVCDRQALGKPLNVWGAVDGVLDLEQPRVWSTAYAQGNGLGAAA